MKIHKIVNTTLAFAVAMTVSLVSSVATAATSPASITAFTGSVSTKTLQVRPKSWRDPAFGNMGWTHHSAWGSFKAGASKMVTIKVASTVPGLYPAVTVWHRGADDTAPNKYVVDHFYPQNANTYQKGAKDEATAAQLGDISMQVVAYGYDQDGHTARPANLNGKVDRKPGEITLTFRTPKSGDYMFVIGGFNPAKTVNATIKHPVTTTVNIQP